MTTLEYDDEASRRLEAMYTTRDVIAQRREVLKALALQPGDQVLDVGVGPGFLAREMAKAVGSTGRVNGIDNSASMLSLAQSRCSDPAIAERVTLEHADATALPFPNDAFNVAVVTQVYEYVAEVPAALRELFRVLRPGGRALIMDTDWDSIVWNSADSSLMNRILLAWEEHAPHVRLPRLLPTLLREAGFQITQSQVFVVFNPDYDPDTYSFRVRDLIAGFVEGKHGLTREDVDAWLADLQHTGENGHYFFSLNRYLFNVTKPNGVSPSPRGAES